MPLPCALRGDDLQQALQEIQTLTQHLHDAQAPASPPGPSRSDHPGAPQEEVAQLSHTVELSEAEASKYFTEREAPGAPE